MSKPTFSPTLPVVLRFAQRMQRKLRHNQHKGGTEAWRNDDVLALAGRITEEYAELMVAIETGGAENIADEAADLANFAMMVADWFLARSQVARESAPSGEPVAETVLATLLEFSQNIEHLRRSEIVGACTQAIYELNEIREETLTSLMTDRREEL